MMTKFSAEIRERIREAFLRSISDVPAQFDRVQEKFVYVPQAHIRALDPDAMLVSGIRGAGKSFWWYALQNQSLIKSVPILNQKIGASVKANAGFGQGYENWPVKDELIELLSKRYDPRIIWKSVVLKNIARDGEVLEGNWTALVSWVSKNPSDVARIIREADARLREQNFKHIILFDALDQAADDWTPRQQLLRGLLELVLELRPTSSIRAKVFVRPDMLADRAVQDFPDASKIVTARVELTWTAVDLFGLLYCYLANADDESAAKAFRDHTRHAWKKKESGNWEVPSILKSDAKAQERVFKDIAGPFMGSGSRRGNTYRWVPNHLADADGCVSPRSFLAAMRGAAEVDEWKSQDYPLHWKGIEEGVRRASQYRATEISEDLPWAHKAMEMLRDLLVPCKKAQIINVWSKGELKKRLANDPKSPRSLEYESILEELRSVGILKLLSDSRINIPDVYRLGFGLRRKGGFRPKARMS